MDSIPVYVVNYKNDERRNRMEERLKTLGFDYKFTDPVEVTDSRLVNASGSVPEDPRVWAIMLQHLDSIRDFYENTTSKHCIVCEDDIYIKKNMRELLVDIIEKFTELKLDVLLLGYLMPYKIEMHTILHAHYYKIISVDEKNGYTYHEYPKDLWGSQMYLISRPQAKHLLDKYTVDYACANLDEVKFNPDWTLTKDGTGAILYPMIAVEEGVNNANETQHEYHKTCCNIHYVENDFI